MWKPVGTVVSETSGKEYTISVNKAGEYGCGCPAWVNKVKRPCKHIDTFLQENGNVGKRTSTLKQTYRDYAAMREPKDGRCKKCGFDHDKEVACIV